MALAQRPLAEQSEASLPPRLLLSPSVPIESSARGSCVTNQVQLRIHSSGGASGVTAGARKAWGSRTNGGQLPSLPCSTDHLPHPSEPGAGTPSKADDPAISSHAMRPRGRLRHRSDCTGASSSTAGGRTAAAAAATAVDPTTSAIVTKRSGGCPATPASYEASAAASLTATAELSSSALLSTFSGISLGTAAPRYRPQQYSDPRVRSHEPLALASTSQPQCPVQARSGRAGIGAGSCSSGGGGGLRGGSAGAGSRLHVGVCAPTAAGSGVTTAADATSAIRPARNAGARLPSAPALPALTLPGPLAANAAVKAEWSAAAAASVAHARPRGLCAKADGRAPSQPLPVSLRRVAVARVSHSAATTAAVPAAADGGPKHPVRDAPSRSSSSSDSCESNSDWLLCSPTSPLPVLPPEPEPSSPLGVPQPTQAWAEGAANGMDGAAEAGGKGRVAAPDSDDDSDESDKQLRRFAEVLFGDLSKPPAAAGPTPAASTGGGGRCRHMYRERSVCSNGYACDNARPCSAANLYAVLCGDANVSRNSDGVSVTARPAPRCSGAAPAALARASAAGSRRSGHGDGGDGPLIGFGFGLGTCELPDVGEGDDEGDEDAGNAIDFGRGRGDCGLGTDPLKRVELLPDAPAWLQPSASMPQGSLHEPFDLGRAYGYAFSNPGRLHSGHDSLCVRKDHSGLGRGSVCAAGMGTGSAAPSRRLRLGLGLANASCGDFSGSGLHGGGGGSRDGGGDAARATTGGAANSFRGGAGDGGWLRPAGSLLRYSAVGSTGGCELKLGGGIGVSRSSSLASGLDSVVLPVCSSIKGAPDVCESFSNGDHVRHGSGRAGGSVDGRGRSDSVRSIAASGEHAASPRLLLNMPRGWEGVVTQVERTCAQEVVAAAVADMEAVADLVAAAEAMDKARRSRGGRRGFWYRLRRAAGGCVAPAARASEDGEDEARWLGVAGA